MLDAGARLCQSIQASTHIQHIYLQLDRTACTSSDGNYSRCTRHIDNSLFLRTEYTHLRLYSLKEMIMVCEGCTNLFIHDLGLIYYY